MSLLLLLLAITLVVVRGEKYFLVVAHPEPKSFTMSMHNAAVEALKKAGHEVKESNLYAMSYNSVSSRENFLTTFDPNYLTLQEEEYHATENNGFAPSVEQEIQKLEWCDVLVLQFPWWWSSMPGIMKGWIDRTFAAGRVYGSGKQGFRGKRAIASFATGADEPAFRDGAMMGDIESLLYPIQHGVFEFTGFDVLEKNVVFGAAYLTVKERQEKIELWAKRVVQLHKEKTKRVGPPAFVPFSRKDEL